MASLWKSLTRAGQGGAYEPAKLIDHRRREDPPKSPCLQLICDIDKTYLETEFDSLLRMVRIAFEPAAQKVTVRGASEVLNAARWGDPRADAEASSPQALPRPLHFVSSSPPQLRAVLEEKLLIDGLDWSTDTFKDQAYNLKMRRVDLLRQHVAYKSLAILRILAQCPPASRFVLIGDNAESDAFIYLGVLLHTSGRLDVSGYKSYLEAGGVEPAVAEDVLKGVLGVGAMGLKIEQVLIRNVPGYTFIAAPPLTDFVQTFDHFFQAALLLCLDGVIEPASLWELTRSFHNQHGMPVAEIVRQISGLKGSGRASPEILAAADEVVMRFGEGKHVSSDAAIGVGFARNLERFSALSGDEIVRSARLWMDAIRHSREAKE